MKFSKRTAKLHRKITQETKRL